MSRKNRIRLFAYTPLSEGGIYQANEDQTHYLKNVMRCAVGDEIFLFDGINGEFCSIISEISKKSIFLKAGQKVFDFEKSPDIWLLFAPLKKENTDFVIEKAVELGVRQIVPVKTEYTQSANFKSARAKAQIIEAAEQSRRQDIALINDPVCFDDLIKNWDKNRKLIYLNETGDGETFHAQKSKLSAPAALFIGPEGGFSKKELEILKNLPYTVNISLPKRILRAETAAVAALACWQAFCGDWK